MKKRASRSRNGCMRCKDRRLKCDETRPACNQCTSRNVICPGYQAPVRWSSKYEVLRPPQDETTQGSRRNRSRTSLSTRLNAHEQAEASSRSPNDPPHTTVRNESGLGTIAIDSIPDNAERREKNITAAEFALVGRDPRSNVLPTVSANLMDNQSSHNNNEATAPVPGMEAYDAFELFNLSDQDFWNSLSVPWPQNLQDFPISRPWSPDTAEANDTGLDRMVMRNDTAEPQIPSFNPNEVTNDDARVLLEYYFTSIIPLNSFYDSDDNPLRYLVSAYVKTSPLIYNCVLSASAMHRMSRNKDMHRVVVHYHSQALQCLETAIERVDVVTQSTVNQVTGGQRDFPAIRVDRLQELLLALLLLGVTASWSDPSNVGIAQLRTARRLFDRWISAIEHADTGSAHSSSFERDKSFIIGCIAYWEAAVAFVLDQPVDSIDYLDAFYQQRTAQALHPNPWTGISTPMFIIMAKVGICVRQQRVISRVGSLGWPKAAYEAMSSQLIARTKKLERFALEYEPPPESQMVVGSNASSVNMFELEIMGQAYRLAALLELYRSFPQLYKRQDLTAALSSGDLMTDAIPSPLSFEQVQAIPATGPRQCQQPRDLMALGIGLLTLIRNTEENRATSLAHSLALIIGGSVLYRRQGRSVYPAMNTDSEQGQLSSRVVEVLLDLNTRANTVDDFRGFVRTRLKSNADLTGLESFRRAQSLMEEIWKGLDNQNLGQSMDSSRSSYRSVQPLIHWMDVMETYRLETLFG